MANEIFEKPETSEELTAKQEVQVVVPEFIKENKTPVLVEQSYDVLAQSIKEQYRLSFSEARALALYLTTLSLDLKDMVGKKILDIGSGQGDFKKAVEKITDGQVVNLDFAERYKSFVDVLGKAEELPFQDESFDLVVARCSVPIMQRREEETAELIPATLNEMIRVAKKGGAIKVYPGLWGGDFDPQEAENNRRLNGEVLRILRKAVEDNPFLEIEAVKIQGRDTPPNYDVRLLEIKKP